MVAMPLHPLAFAPALSKTTPSWLLQASRPLADLAELKGQGLTLKSVGNINRQVAQQPLEPSDG
jgi:hypothetical protein